MLWICRDCGGEMETKDAADVVEAGWTSLDGDTGVCPPCGRSDGLASPSQPGPARRSKDRVRRRTGTVAIGQARGDRRNDEQAADLAAPAVELSDRHEYVLALFKYGLVDSPRDLAIVMNIAESAAREMCDTLVAAGLLAEAGTRRS